MHEKEYNASVYESIETNPGNLTLRIIPDRPIAPFIPGQYMILGLKSGEKRAVGSLPERGSETRGSADMIRKPYFIASDPGCHEYLEFYINLVYSGELTPRLFALQKKDRLYASNRGMGAFTIDKIPEDKHILLIATGSGLAPYMSIIRASVGLSRERRFVVIHGASCSKDLGFYQELSMLAQITSLFYYLPTIAPLQPNANANANANEEDWQGYQGDIEVLIKNNIVDQIVNIPLHPDNYHVLLCGSPRMVASLQSLLMDKGFNPDSPDCPGNVHSERY